jgi:hypothetical protein
MRGSLGEKIGEGAFADVHAWAPGQVVKLFKAGVPQRVSWWEARMTRAVFAAGGPAPEVLSSPQHSSQGPSIPIKIGQAPMPVYQR